MRKLILVAVTLLCSGLWAFAQSTSPTSPSSSSPSSSSSASDMSGQSSASATGAGNTTIEGCLGGSAGNYTLKDKAGTTYNLTGPDSQIASHIGQSVRVTGSSSASSAASANGPSSSPSSSGSAMSNGAGSSSSNQSFMVSSITKVSSSCSNQ